MKPVIPVILDEANNQLLYFTSSSLSADDARLYYLSDRTGAPNVFVRELSTGRDLRLTDNPTGYLKSYVYFDGTPHSGLGKASACLDAAHDILYFLQGDAICAAQAGQPIRCLNRVRPEEVTAFCAVSADGTRLCVPTTQQRALEYGPLTDNKVPYDIDARVQAEHLSSYLNVYSTETGALLLREEVKNAWVTHVQFRPGDPDTILYNHEWASNDCGIRRMWLFDGKTHTPVRTEGEGRSRKDWTCHEMFSADGETILYHGIYQNGPAYVGQCCLKTMALKEVSLPADYTPYGHFTLGDGSVLASDGYYQKPGDPEAGCGQYITVLRPDWENGTLAWTPLAAHGSSWASQDSHPHPILDHAGRFVYFTSDVSGHRGIYRAVVPER